MKKGELSTRWCLESWNSGGPGRSTVRLIPPWATQYDCPRGNHLKQSPARALPSLLHETRTGQWELTFWEEWPGLLTVSVCAGEHWGGGGGGARPRVTVTPTRASRALRRGLGRHQELVLLGRSPKDHLGRYSASSDSRTQLRTARSETDPCA